MREFNYGNTASNIWNDCCIRNNFSNFCIVTLMKKKFPMKALSAVIIVNRSIEAKRDLNTSI